MKKQSEKTQEVSNNDSDKKSNFTTKDIEGNDSPTSNDGKNKSAIELLKNFTTHNGIINGAKIKNTFKNSSTDSNSIKSITEKKRQKYITDAIDTYKLMDNNDLLNSKKDILA